MFRFRRPCIRLLAAVFCWLTLLPAASADTLETDSLQLRWADNSAELIDWRVRADDRLWVCLVTRGESSRSLSRHLDLTGAESVVPSVWVPADVADGVAFRGTSSDGRLRFTQHIAPAEDEFRLRYRLELENITDTDWQPDGEQTIRLRLGPGLGEYPTAGYGVADTLYSFVEPVISAGGEARAVPLRGITDEHSIPFDVSSAADWVGLHSRYFALIIAPEEGNAITAIDFKLPDNHVTDRGAMALPMRYLPSVVLQMPVPRLAPGESRVREFVVFSGPKSRAALAGGELDLGALSFVGLWDWLRGLCIGLLWLLGMIHVVVPNWGLAIIVLALLVRLLLYPVAKRALASQHAFTEVQKKIQPELRHIKSEYRGEEQSERILGLYERYGVSPLAGLKPLLIVLIQIPVFIALFHVLGQAYELRGTSFLWIDSLAEPDRLFSLGLALPYFGSHFNLLPILLAVTTLMTIKLAPAPAADARARTWQNAFLTLMAIGFLVLFYPFPSGMVLYWTMANLLHLAQQYVVER